MTPPPAKDDKPTDADKEAKKAAIRARARARREASKSDSANDADAGSATKTGAKKEDASKADSVAADDAKEAPKRRVETKAPEESKKLEGDEAKEKMSGLARAKSIDPKTIKLPQFPKPSAKRPGWLDNEEGRRHIIDQLVQEYRNGKLEELDKKFEKKREGIKTKDEVEIAIALRDLEKKQADELRKLEQKWRSEDDLVYRANPDDKEIEVYEVTEGFSYVQIIQNQKTHEMMYHVIEPRLTPDEYTFLKFIEQTLVDVLDLQPSELDDTELEEYIEQKFEQVMKDYSIHLDDDPDVAVESRRRLLYYVVRDFMGEGPIDVMMNDPMIEDISCDGPHVPVFVYHRKYEALTSTVKWKGHDQLDSFVIRMAQRAGKHISIAEPILDGTMRDGSRLQATLSKEVSSYGSTFTLRKFKEVPFTPVDLVRFGTLSSQMMAYIWMVIEAHMSAIYAGGTASGKTTSINALMMFIPPQNKVITIEDTRELQVPEPNWIAGITRDGFGPRDEHGRQAGEIDMFQLLKNALRQRPEYIIVGEVRGKEAYSLFQAMATGHAAYGTMHADSVDAVIHRLNSDPINIPRSLLEALDVVAVQSQVRVGGKRARRTRELQEIVGLDPNTQEILTNSVFEWDPAKDEFRYSGSSYNLERIAAETGRTIKQVTDDMMHRAKLLDHMVELGISDYKTVAQIIKSQYRDPDMVAKWMKGGKQWK